MEFLLKCYDNIIENFEDIKNIDDEESQKEMWNEKLLEEFNLRIILNRPLDPDFIRTIMPISRGRKISHFTLDCVGVQLRKQLYI